MLDFLFDFRNLPFTVSLALLFVLLLIETAGFLFGADLSAVFGEGISVSEGLSVGEGLPVGFLTSFLYWLNIGRVPVVILLVVFLAIYALVGYALQYAFLSMTGYLMPAYVAGFAALFPAIPAVRWSGRAIGRVVPRDETEAVSVQELVGSRAVIVIGSARAGSPAQARTSDRFGTNHYVMVEPDEPEAVLETGRQLLLVRYDGNKFFAIYHPEPA